MMWLQLSLLSIYNYNNFVTIFTKKEVKVQDMYLVKLKISMVELG